MKEWFDRDLCPGYDCQRGGTLGKALRMMGAHTKTQIITTFEGANCDQVKKEVNARIQGEMGWLDPFNQGIYQLESATENQFNLEHLDGHYQHLDKVNLKFVQVGDTCEVHGCSERQKPGYKDDHANYCNMHNLYCGSKDGCPTVMADFDYTEQVAAWSMQADPKKCLRSYWNKEGQFDKEQRAVMPQADSAYAVAYDVEDEKYVKQIAKETGKTEEELGFYKKEVSLT